MENHHGKKLSFQHFQILKGRNLGDLLPGCQDSTSFYSTGGFEFFFKVDIHSWRGLFMCNYDHFNLTLLRWFCIPNVI